MLIDLICIINGNHYNGSVLNGGNSILMMYITLVEINMYRHTLCQLGSNLHKGTVISWRSEVYELLLSM